MWDGDKFQLITTIKAHYSEVFCFCFCFCFSHTFFLCLARPRRYGGAVKVLLRRCEGAIEALLTMCCVCVKVWCLAISKSGDMLVSGTLRSIKAPLSRLYEGSIKAL
jgi:hypothetical protein